MHSSKSEERCVIVHGDLQDYFRSPTDDKQMSYLCLGPVITQIVKPVSLVWSAYYSTIEYVSFCQGRSINVGYIVPSARQSRMRVMRGVGVHPDDVRH